MKYLPLIFFTTLLLTGCDFLRKKSKQERVLVASVGENQLFEDQFQEIFSSASTPEDSILLRENYIQNWIKQELIFNKALENLTDSVKDKERELKQYYRSLIRYEYENALINQKLDTAVDKSEIIAYYETYQESFDLKRSAVRMLILKLDAKVSKVEKVKAWLDDLSVENYDSLHKFCMLYANKFYIDDTKWMYYDDMMREMNAPNYVLEQAINKKHTTVHADSVNIFLIKVLEFKGMGETMPLPLASSKIRILLRNKKKVEFLREMERTIMDEATAKNKYKIYK